MESNEPLKRGLWAQAQALALQTPESRNRYVDFLRALSILAVISGHWLMAAPHVVEGNLAIANMLELEPWTRWLTWGFQVMPIFFLVGGYANGVSWNAATRDGHGYSDWLTSRLGRLIKPVLPLVAAWIVIGGSGQRDRGSIGDSCYRFASSVSPDMVFVRIYLSRAACSVDLERLATIRDGLVLGPSVASGCQRRLVLCVRFQRRWMA